MQRTATLLLVALAAACAPAARPVATPVRAYLAGAAVRGGTGATSVAVRDAAGAVAEQAAGQGGAYRIEVTGLTPPFAVRATFASAGPLHSLAAAPGRCDVNLLTEAVLEAAGGGAALFAGTASLDAAVAALPGALASLRQRLAAIGGGAAVDPFSAPAGDPSLGLAATLEEAAGGALVLHATGGGTSVTLGPRGAAIALHAWERPAGEADPRVAAAAGAALVVWTAHAADHSDVWAQWRTAGGWQVPVRLTATGKWDAEPAVALDGQGNGWVAWCHWNGTDASVWVAPITSTTWGPPVALDERPGHACAPRVAASAAGAAVAWTRQPWGGAADVWVSRLSGGAWGAPEAITDQQDANVLPAPFLDDDGALTVAWVKSATPHQAVWSARAPAGGPFAPPAQRSPAGADVGPEIALAGDGAGGLVLVWAQSSAGTGILPVAALHPAGGTWSEAAAVGDGAGDARAPAVAMNRAGSAVAAWKQVSQGAHRIHAARLDPASGWGAPAALEDGGADADYPAAAIDAAGSALVAWTLRAGDTVHLQAARSFAGGGWLGATDEEQAVAQVPAGLGYYPLRLAMDPAGLAVAAWSEDSL